MQGEITQTNRVAEAIIGRKLGEELFLWQDREIRFDVPAADLELRRGEILLDYLDDVEDTKGEKEEKGSLQITNLRLIWISKKSKRTSICVGYNCVTALNVRTDMSRLKGHQQLLVLTRYNQQRFEFIFTHPLQPGTQPFSNVQGVFRAYDTSRLYRDLKLRGALIQDGELKLLPMEETYSKVNGVWNLSSEQGNLGTFFITNVRVVWHANLNEGFNVSIPYLQMKNVKVRDSKFGQALVIETVPKSGGYVLGFKIDPKETMDYVFKEISSLWQVYSVTPVLGIEFGSAMASKLDNKQTITQAEEDVEILDPGDKGDILAVYSADATKGLDRNPVYHTDLGLAVEGLRDGVTIDQLWSVV